jgi:spermidine synthase
VSLRFEELDFQATPFGEVSLRRRVEPSTGVDVYEVKLGEDFLMSSLFTVAEEELSRLGLAAATGEALEVMVGGLGLGYTAVAALEDPRIAKVVVVDALAAVIDWHERGLLPVSRQLTGDPRVSFLLADFFAMMRDAPAAQYDALLIDIDHSPRHLLDPSHADLYTLDGLRGLAAFLRPAGVFALWSDDPPDEEFLADLHRVFATAAAHVVAFDNFLTGGTSTNTVYVATR